MKKKMILIAGDPRAATAQIRNRWIRQTSRVRRRTQSGLFHTTQLCGIRHRVRPMLRVDSWE